jgi:uncharacterized protein (TIGR02646 family)
VFQGICAYCEERDHGEVDHFQPKSQFPKMVYEWSNWVFSCQHCNHTKSEKWPSGGFVNPCAKTMTARPESYFGFDLLTGELIPNQGLSEVRGKRTRQMIPDLGLNDSYHLKNRLRWIQLVAAAVNGDPKVPDLELLDRLEDRGSEYSSLVRAWADSLGI